MPDMNNRYKLQDLINSYNRVSRTPSEVLDTELGQIALRDAIKALAELERIAVIEDTRMQLLRATDTVNRLERELKILQGKN